MHGLRTHRESEEGPYQDLSYSLNTQREESICCGWGLPFSAMQLVSFPTSTSPRVNVSKPEQKQGYNPPCKQVLRPANIAICTCKRLCQSLCTCTGYRGGTVLRICIVTVVGFPEFPLLNLHLRTSVDCFHTPYELQSILPRVLYGILGLYWGNGKENGNYYVT